VFTQIIMCKTQHFDIFSERRRVNFYNNKRHGYLQLVNCRKAQNIRETGICVPAGVFFSRSMALVTGIGAYLVRGTGMHKKSPDVLRGSFNKREAGCYKPNNTSSAFLPPKSMRVGFSSISFTFTRKPTLSLPSMIR
jgi:hypothetical protein